MGPAKSPIWNRFFEWVLKTIRDSRSAHQGLGRTVLENNSGLAMDVHVGVVVDRITDSLDTETQCEENRSDPNRGFDE